MTQYYAATRIDRRSSASMSQSGQTAWRRNQNTVAFRVQRGLGPVTNTVLVILLLSVLGLIYLTQITKTSTYGYQMNELEQQKTELLSERADLQAESARLEALNRIQQSEVASNLETPASTEYLN